MLQQYLSFTVCAVGCETAEEQGDDEVRTSQVHERSEGKTKVMRQWPLLFTVLKHHFCGTFIFMNIDMLQQLLPFTVLKHWLITETSFKDIQLQQHLPFTVLKLVGVDIFAYVCIVATALTVYGMRRRV